MTNDDVYTSCPNSSCHGHTSTSTPLLTTNSASSAIRYSNFKIASQKPTVEYMIPSYNLKGTDTSPDEKEGDESLISYKYEARLGFTRVTNFFDHYHTNRLI